MDEVTHTILPNSGNGWGGALGAAFPDQRHGPADRRNN